MITDDTLVLRGGQMGKEPLEAHLEDVRVNLQRPGICLKVMIDDRRPLTDPELVKNPTFCLSTPALLREAGLDPSKLDPTNDFGDRYHYTLWLPDEPADTLVEMLWAAFRGPIPKGDASSAWTTEDLRRLQHPRP